MIDETAFMTIAAARRLQDDEACFVGIGLPSLAALVARHTHAPGLSLIYESGAYGADPASPPMSTGSPSVANGAACLGDCLLVFGELQAGRIDVGIMSAAQVDRRGNLNSTVIGDYRTPKIRMVGSGGAHDIAALVGRLVIVMPHDPRRFVEQVDFVTAPGLGEDGQRPTGTHGVGPIDLLTSRAWFTFEKGEMTLAGLQPGVDPETAVEGFPWEVPQTDHVVELAPPSLEELAVLQRWHPIGGIT